MESICNPTWWVRLSLISKVGDEEYELGQEITNLITVIVCILFLQYCRYKQRFEAFRCDVKTTSASDYSIIVENLPIDCTVSEIRHFFENCLENDANLTAEEKRSK